MVLKIFTKVCYVHLVSLQTLKMLPLLGYIWQLWLKSIEISDVSTNLMGVSTNLFKRLVDTIWKGLLRDV